MGVNKPDMSRLARRKRSIFIGISILLALEERNCTKKKESNIKPEGQRGDEGDWPVMLQHGCGFICRANRKKGKKRKGGGRGVEGRASE